MTRCGRTQLSTAWHETGLSFDDHSRYPCRDCKVPIWRGVRNARRIRTRVAQLCDLPIYLPNAAGASSVTKAIAAGPTLGQRRVRAGKRCAGNPSIRGSSRRSCRNCGLGSPGRSARRLDARHVGVAEAEMVADLVDHHVTHQKGEILTGLAPVVEDRPTVEKD